MYMAAEVCMSSCLCEYLCFFLKGNIMSVIALGTASAGREQLLLVGFKIGRM